MATYHTVQQGDCLSSIAQKYGFRDYRTIYDDGNNAELKKKRPDPNILFPGDRVFIPDKLQKNESGPTGDRHTFELSLRRVFLDLVISVDEEPLANAEYDLSVGEKKIHGKTNAGGLLHQEIDASAQSGKLIFQTPAIEWDLQLGHLDPVKEVNGVQQRLNNLGFSCGDADGAIGPRTRAALRQFQAHRSLKVTAALNDATEGELSKDIVPAT